MAENYKTSPEWQALNRIWKALPAASRESVKDDFRVITELIKNMPDKKTPAPAPAAPAAPAMGATNFLAGLSGDAKKLALTLLTKEGFDVYAYLTTLAQKTRATSPEELFDAYISQRDIPDDQEEALMELIRASMKGTRP